MNEKKKTGSSFRKGLLIYGAVLLALSLLVWAAAWCYASAYEQAQPVGAINAYVQDTLKAELAAGLEDYSAKQANEYQSAEQIYTDLSEKLFNGEWKYRKSKGYRSDAPVYTLYCDGMALCEAHLSAGKAGLLDFGLTPWQVQPIKADMSGLEKTVTVYAPVGCKITLNGAPVKPTEETAGFYPEFAEYETSIKKPMELQVYRVPEISINEVTVECSGDCRMVAGEEANTYYAVPLPDEDTVMKVEDLAPKFVDAYLMFTSNAGSYYTVNQYVAPESELQARLYKSLDGMSWVHYTTGKLLDIQVRDIAYYGNVATFDASYELNLKSGAWAGDMHVVMVQAAYGWRVTDIEMF